MIPGYNFIERQSPAHEPNIVGTRLTVTWVAHDVNNGTRLEDIMSDWSGRVNRHMLDEALRYYENNKQEIDGYIDDSRKRSGMIIKDGQIIQKPHE